MTPEQIESTRELLAALPEDERPILARAAAEYIRLHDHYKRCVAALQQIAQLADTGSELHKQRFQPNAQADGIANGWRVAEAMREAANDVVGSVSLPTQEIAHQVRELLLYKRAMEAMAEQFVHPKTTAKELAEQILRGRQ